MIALLLSIIFLATLSDTAPLPFVSAARAETVPVKDTYTCPMHPQVRSHEPGKCPICFMALQKIVSPEPRTLPAGAPPSAEKKIKFYRNPMNPLVTSKVPAKDNMGMDYIPIYEMEGSPAQNTSDVPFHGEVNIDQTQLSLSGAVLTKVERRDLMLEIPVSGRALNSSRVALQVREREIGSLQVGLEVMLTSASLPGKEVIGKITGLDFALDPMTRTLRVNVALSRSHSALKSEASVEGFVRRKLPAVLTVPREGIMPGPRGSTYAYVADNNSGKLIPRKVVLGARGRDYIELVSGLNEGELISAGPNFLIDSESRIRSTYDQ